MKHHWLIIVVLVVAFLRIDRALAHDPDAPEIDVPEVSVIEERPVGA